MNPLNIFENGARHMLFGSKREVIFAYADGAVTTHDRIRLANPDLGRKTEYGDSEKKVIDSFVERA